MTGDDKPAGGGPRDRPDEARAAQPSTAPLKSPPIIRGESEAVVGGAGTPRREKDDE